MSIRFDTDKMPTKEMILDQAAGVGIQFEPESMAELFFVEFCLKLWMHGSDTGIRRMHESHEKSISRLVSMFKPN